MCRRLRKIDELVLSQHYYLDPHDDCYYLMEYLPKQDPKDNNVTALIYNLKNLYFEKTTCENMNGKSGQSIL